MVRVGIAGTGFIGGIHARSARLARGHLVGVAASNPERSRRAAEALGADRAFESAEALATAEDIDVVHICTPNHLHAPLAELALAAGKHVICEKPLAMDSAQARRLTDVASDAPGVAAVPFVYRYYPTVREARERVRQGETGALRLIHGTYLQDWLLRPEDDNWRVDEHTGGASRAFADIGSHWCDLAEFISGTRITRVCARLLTAVPDRERAEARAAFAQGDGTGERRRVGTEDAAVVQFETDTGAVGATVVSQISAGRKNRLWLELDGAEESVAFDQESPETLWVGRREHDDADQARSRVPVSRPRRALPSCPPVIRRAMRTASTPSWTTSMPPSRAPSRPRAAGLRRRSPRDRDHRCRPGLLARGPLGRRGGAATPAMAR